MRIERDKTKKLEGAEADSPQLADPTATNPTTEANRPAPSPVFDLEAEDFDDRRVGERRGQHRRFEDQDLVSNAQQEADQIRAKAKEEGLQQGLKEAEAIKNDLKKAIDQFLKAREAVFLSAADHILPMAIQVAEKLIETEVTCDPALIQTLLMQTIQQTGEDTKYITVKVNPAEVDSVRQYVQDQGKVLHPEATINVVADKAVASGSCILETASGQIDASFKTQLNTLKLLLGIS